MIKPLTSPDVLANASLSPQERQAWETARADLDTARAQIRDLEKRIRELEHKTTDEPAVILTRPEFNREVARMLAFDERYGGVSSVLYFDFENMEQAADRFGKSVINAAIREIMTQLTRHVRGADIIGRLAPDEFGVLLVRCNNTDAWKKGKELSETLNYNLAEVHGCKLDLHISYGAYTFREEDDVSTGLKEASLLMTRMVKQ